jgi:hypothetical protein
MRNLITQISLFSTASVIAFSLTSCGMSKVKECNIMGKVLKDNKTALEEIEASAKSKNTNVIIQSFLLTSTKVGKLSKDMQALEIKDEKLVSLQSQFAKLYQDNSKGLTDVAKGLQTNNKSMRTSAIAKMQEGDKQEAVMIKNINDYCGLSNKESTTKAEPSNETTTPTGGK